MKELKQGIRRARRGYEMTLASQVKENPKAFETYIKNKKITRERIGPLKDKGRKLCLEAENVGEILNEYFASVFTEQMNVEDSGICVELADMLGHFEIKKEVVLGLLKNIEN